MAAKVAAEKTTPKKHKSKPKRKEQVQYFDMSAAMEECRARERRQRIAREHEQREQRQLREAAARDMSQLRQQGALQILPTGGREAWIARCFQLIQLIRDTPDCKAQYNRDWKETNRFMAGMPRK